MSRSTPAKKRSFAAKALKSQLCRAETPSHGHNWIGPCQCRSAPMTPSALAVSCSDVLDSLDHEVLKITGLDAGRYSLHIDGGKPVGTFTREQLNEGLNLALLPTPMSKQAAKVHDLTLQ